MLRSCFCALGDLTARNMAFWIFSGRRADSVRTQLWCDRPSSSFFRKILLLSDGINLVLNIVYTAQPPGRNCQPWSWMKLFTLYPCFSTLTRITPLRTWWLSLTTARVWPLRSSTTGRSTDSQSSYDATRRGECVMVDAPWMFCCGTT